jgi:hypothetical protein
VKKRIRERMLKLKDGSLSETAAGVLYGNLESHRLCIVIETVN